MKYLQIFVLLLLPNIALAALGQNIGFTVQPYDISANFLNSLLGIVPGTGSEILGQLFSVFNAAVLTLGGGLIAYTLTVSTLNTSQEGEIMGKQWSSVWIPMRTVMGIALLIPKATGYCMIQIFFLFVVVQGIGAANKVWISALDYLDKGGVIVKQGQSFKEQGLQELVTNSATILRAEVCMAYLHKQLETLREREVAQGSSLQAVPAFLNFAPYKGNEQSAPLPYIPDGDWKAYNGACGSLDYNQSYTPNADAAHQQLFTAQYTGAAQMFYQLANTAQMIVNNDVLSENKLPIGDCKITNDSCIPANWSVNSLLRGYELVQATQSYQGIVSPAQNNLIQQSHQNKEFIAKAKQEGWIVAGKYFFDLAKINTQQMLSFLDLPILTNLPDNLCATDTMKSVPGCSNMQSLVNGTELKNYANAAAVYTIETGQNAAKPSFGGGINLGSSRFATAVSSILNKFTTITNAFGNALVVHATDANPLISLSQFGITLLRVVTIIWISGAIYMGVIGLSLGLVWWTKVSGGLVAFLVFFVPIFFTITAPLLVAGATFAFYIPLIPYIIFSFAALGWFIAVIETLVAAPLVALGLASPEGASPVVGIAEPAVMLLANVFLRPTLMIFGFIVAIVLSYVGIWYLNEGFLAAFAALRASGGLVGLAWIFSMVAKILIYLVLVVTLLNRVFSLIHVIPDQILRWISGGAGQFGEITRGGEEAVRGTFGGAAEPAAGALAKGGMESFRERYEAQQKALEDSKIKAEKADTLKTHGDELKDYVDQNPNATPDQLKMKLYELRAKGISKNDIQGIIDSKFSSPADAATNTKLTDLVKTLP